MLIPDRIKAAVTTMEACSRYGIEVNRAGFACCPFHSEKTPSMKIYKGDRGWHCFGCGKSGSVIDLTMGLFNLPFLDACEKLNEDFNLGIDIGKPMTRTQKIAANKEAWERRKAKEKVENEHRALIDRFNRAVTLLRVMEEEVETQAPTDRDAEWPESFCYALFTQSTARQDADEALEALAEFEKKMYARS
jgi:hypothetical protein